jgi:hypothetical protein
VVFWNEEGPLKEVYWVLEAEGRLGVLHVVGLEELVNFVEMRRVLQIEGCPDEAWRQGQGLLGYLREFFEFDGALF